MEHLLALAAGSEQESRAVLTEDDAALLLTEIAGRATLFDGPPEPVTVQIDLGTAGKQLGYLVTVGPGGSTVEPGWSADAPARIRQDLAELLHAVYGLPGGGHATREIELMPAPPPEEVDPAAVFRRRRAAALAVHQLVKASSAEPADLDTLALRFGSDKWGDHWYTPHYQRHFAPYREDRIRLLEIGVGGYDAPDEGGESLRMWKHYFRRGLVHGLDIFDKSRIDEPRLRTHVGSQADPVFLAGLAARIGPLDVVIDDGSHLSADVISSFRTLFPLVRPGGLYVIEDLQTSYWTGWNGGHPESGHPDTSLGFLRTLVDALHHQERLDVPAAELDRWVGALHVYHNIAFIEKRLNAEQGSPAWIPRDLDPSVWMYPQPEEEK
ncbi:class I SAM-dependent methyltransferase [Micromonospora aurantiaca (nom. illeg.)]|uniref:class I SAM-dependent methyltransferase n=1 Tax=Micromonospora aurantiaca (nom. illeg.) TaxID=47850 RepID=UPI003EBE4B05